MKKPAGEPSHTALLELVGAIIAGDGALVAHLLAASPDLAAVTYGDGTHRHSAKEYILEEIGHYIYVGDTALHIASAAYQHKIAPALIAAGANVRARNRRGAEPLHYAADGVPGSRAWNPDAQSASIAGLIRAGADPNAVDNSGVAPLHRAVRTRCASAVKALLDGGADVLRKNGNGSTPMQLATRNTGRGGSGLLEAKMQQEEIVRLLEQHGAG
jgi:hypothetical protein